MTRKAHQVAEWAAVTGDFAVEAPVPGHHLFVYDEAARAQWFAGVTGCIDMVVPRPLRQYVVSGKNGAALRSGCELTTPQVEPARDRRPCVLPLFEGRREARAHTRLGHYSTRASTRGRGRESTGCAHPPTAPHSNSRVPQHARRPQELARGTTVLVCEESVNSKGTERIHIVSYEAPEGGAQVGRLRPSLHTRALITFSL